MGSSQIRQKWRPSLSMIVLLMLSIVLALPVATIWIFRFYENQLVQETESELIAQGYALSAITRRLVSESDQTDLFLSEHPVSSNRNKRGNLLTPALPQLDLASAKILPPRADSVEIDEKLPDHFSDLGRRLAPVINDIVRHTLAGIRILDHSGRVIAGASDIGASFSHVEEVQAALKGKYHSVLRQRISDKPVPPLASISRGASIRVFVSIPVIQSDRLIGVVYLSRTPSNILKKAYYQRWRVLAAMVALLLAAAAIAYIFIRAVRNPIVKLQAAAEQISERTKAEFVVPDHFGSRELASLSQSILSMSAALQDRANYINSFARHVSHELKSPLTSIKGAAELLQDDMQNMDKAQQAKFLQNIEADVDKMNKLLLSLRELAKAENPLEAGQVSFDALKNVLPARYPEPRFVFRGPKEIKFPLTEENALIILGNLAENSIQHQADEITIEAREEDSQIFIKVHDNGSGIAEENRQKIFDLFFTTRRNENGTGMGLAIVQAVLKAHGGEIRLVEHQEGGAAFEIILGTTSC